MLGTIDREHVVRVADLRRGDAAALIDRAAARGLVAGHGELLGSSRRCSSAWPSGNWFPPSPATSCTSGCCSGWPASSPGGRAALLPGRVARAPRPRAGARPAHRLSLTLLRVLAFRPADAAAPGAVRARPQAASAAAAPRRGHSCPAMARRCRRRSAGDAGGRAAALGQIVARLDINGPVRELAKHCALLERRGRWCGSRSIRARPRCARGREDTLAQALGRYFGEPVRMEIEVRGQQRIRRRARRAKRRRRRRPRAPRSRAIRP
jgi:hypothetical protein